MDEKFFKNWKFIYEDSDDITIHLEVFRKDEKEPYMIKEISTEELKKTVGTDHAYHIEFDGSFDLVLHAIKNNEVYVSLLMRTSEYGWKTSEQFVLNKKMPCKASKIMYFNNDHGAYLLFIKEWGSIKKRRIVY